ncbi:MAG: tetratricopeptide repeat protein, partial [bacterium]
PGLSGNERVDALNKLATTYAYRDFNRSLQYVDEAFFLAERSGYGKGMADALRNYGHIYQYQGNYPRALDYYMNSLSLFEELQMKNEAGDLCYDIGKTHYLARDAERAIEYAYLALEKYRERLPDGRQAGNVKDTLRIYCSLGLQYFLMGKCDISLQYTLAYLDLAIKNNFDIRDIYLIEIVTAERFYCNNQPDSAKVFLLRALNHTSENHDIETLKHRAVSFLAQMYSQEGKMDSAILFLSKAYRYFHEHGLLSSAVDASSDLGYLYYTTGDLERSENYFNISERIYNEMLARESWYAHDSLENTVTWGLELYFPLPEEKAREMIWLHGRFIYYWLFRIYNDQGKTDAALKYHIAYTDVMDTLNQIQRSNDLIELQTRYESERNEKEIEELAQRNSIQELRLDQSRYLLFGLILLTTLIILVAMVIFRMYKLRAGEHTAFYHERGSAPGQQIPFPLFQTGKEYPGQFC